MITDIYIFSRPVKTGKTSELKDWISHERKVAGVMMPDIEGTRKLAEILSGDIYDFEVQEPGEGIVTVGQYHFKEEIFQKGREILLGKHKVPIEWVVVDEVGPLEIRGGAGFEPAVSEVIKDYKEGSRHGKLLLVVRDTVLKEMQEHYGLEEATVVNSLEELSK